MDHARNYRIEEGMTIRDKYGEKIGDVGQVVVGKGSREPRFFTIEKGMILHKDYLVPRECIQHVDDEGAVIGLTDAQVRTMPEWDGDAPTEEEVQQAFENIGAREHEPGAFSLDNAPWADAGSSTAGGAADAPYVITVEEWLVLTPEERERHGYGSEWAFGGPSGNR